MPFDCRQFAGCLEDAEQSLLAEMECVNRKTILSKARGVTPLMKTTSQVATGVFQERAPLAERKFFQKL
jgi:hypothetical protein